MATILERLEDCQQRYEALSGQLADPTASQNSANYQKLAKELGEMVSIVRLGEVYRDVRRRLAEADEILRTEDDVELVELATAEQDELKAEEVRLDAEIRLLLIPKDPND